MHSTFSLEIYSRIWSAALFPVTSPHPSVKVYADIVGLRGAGGVFSRVGDHILRGVLPSVCDQIQNLQNCLPTPGQ
jgi:hypothetical protein